MRSVLFLVSGGGGTLKFIHQAASRLSEPIEVAGVVADRTCGALEYAQSRKISSRVIEYSRSSPEQLREAISEMPADFVITNFHKVIDVDTLALKPGRFFNLHYSLLPDFAGMIGMKTLEAAEKAGAKRVGATCHLVEEKVDAGKILGQAAIPVTWNENRADLMNALFRSACLCLANVILTQGSLQTSPGQARAGKLSTHTELGFSVFFTPELVFDPSRFDQNFWAGVAAS